MLLWPGSGAAAARGAPHPGEHTELLVTEQPTYALLHRLTTFDVGQRGHRLGQLEGGALVIVEQTRLAPGEQQCQPLRDPPVLRARRWCRVRQKAQPFSCETRDEWAGRLSHILGKGQSMMSSYSWCRVRYRATYGQCGMILLPDARTSASANSTKRAARPWPP